MSIAAATPDGRGAECDRDRTPGKRLSSSGHTLSLCARHQRAPTPRPRGRLRGARSALCRAAARVPGACLFLEKGDGAAGVRGLPCRGAGSARLRAHHGLGQRLRWRPRFVSPDDSRSRCSRTRVGDRLSLRRGGGRTRLRVARCGLVRVVAAGRFSLGRADERAPRCPPPLPFNIVETPAAAAANAAALGLRPSRAAGATPARRKRSAQKNWSPATASRWKVFRCVPRSARHRRRRDGSQPKCARTANCAVHRR